MDTLTARPEYGVLKTHTLCIKIPCSRQRSVFGALCLENEFFEENGLSKSDIAHVSMWEDKERGVVGFYVFYDNGESYDDYE
jgi:hypothetical protein